MVTGTYPFWGHECPTIEGPDGRDIEYWPIYGANITTQTEPNHKINP